MDDHTGAAATAVAQPNIALVKSWGKRAAALNLPAGGSISITLGDLRTRTTIRFDAPLAASRRAPPPLAPAMPRPRSSPATPGR